MQHLRFTFALLASLYLVAAHADQNAATQPVQSTMEAFLVEVDSEGKESLQKTTTAEPGQTIEWKVTFSNVTANVQKNLVVSGPIPDGTEYVAGSAKTDVAASLLVSVDNGRSFVAEPVLRDVKKPDGSVSREVVPAEEYDYVRWQSAEPLAAYSSQVFTYRVRVE